MMALWLVGIYMLLPLAEGAVIIVLAMVVGQRGRTIKALQGKLEWYQKRGAEPASAPVFAQFPDKPAVSAADSATESKRASMADRPKFQPAFPSKPRFAAAGDMSQNSMWQGTAALVIGVVFVILAGIIFATTAWRVLPDIGKALVVTAFSGIFFGASAVAERRLQIRRTAKAFYILGSMFLSVAVLAVGFFELLGPELSLFGRNWCLVLLLGAVMTQGALLVGLKKYAEPVYAGCSLAGFTVIAALAVGSLHPGAGGFALGMAVYGLLVLAATETLRRNTESRIPQSIARLLPEFAAINLWVISALVLVVFGRGPVTGTAAFLMAGIHLYLGMNRSRESGNEPASGFAGNKTPAASTAAFTALLLVGLWRAVAPESAAACLYILAAVLVLLAVLKSLPFFSVLNGYLRAAELAMAGLLAGGVMLEAVWEYGLTFHGMVCMALLLLDITLEAFRHKNMLISCIHSLMTAAFACYFVFYLVHGNVRQLFVAALVFSVLFLAEERIGWPLANRAGDLLFTALAGFFTVLLLWSALLIYGSAEPLVLAAVAILAFTAVVARWSRSVSQVRCGIPLVLAALPFLAASLAKLYGYAAIDGQLLLMVLLAALMIWDLRKKDRMQAGILALACVAGLGYFFYNQWRGFGSLPFYLAAAIYLAIKCREQESEKRILSEYGVCVLILLETYTACSYWMDIQVSIHLAVLAVLGAEYAVWRLRRKDMRMERFFQVAFMLALLAVTGAFYGGLWQAAPVFNYLPAVLAAFAVVYLLTYRTGNLNLNFFTAAAALYMPVALLEPGACGLSEAQIYGGTLLGLSVYCGGCRLAWPVAGGAGQGSSAENFSAEHADWFAILAGLLLVLLGITAPGRGWRFACILLEAAWAVQFAAIPRGRRAAFTVALGLTVAAFWAQPFIAWPGIVRLEINLIPAAGFVWAIGKIWDSKPAVVPVQTALYTLCLFALAGDAVAHGKLADALILEGICLAVFLPACVKRCRRWIWISGGTALAVALYVTRGFWLSISWWVYLLAAGIGLILFAARGEMKKH